MKITITREVVVSKLLELEAAKSSGFDELYPGVIIVACVVIDAWF